MPLNWPSAGAFLRPGFETGHGKAMPMIRSRTSNLDATSVSSGVPHPYQNGGKSADAERLVFPFFALDYMLT